MRQIKGHSNKRDLLVRFWSKVEKSDSCWNWKGYLDPIGGYGIFGAVASANNMKAHRFSYELLRGPIPKDKECHHICENPRCVNPDHIELVTRLEHAYKNPKSLATINSNKTHCPYGHEFTPENTRVSPRGTRVCRSCDSLRYYVLNPEQKEKRCEWNREYMRRKRASLKI